MERFFVAIYSNGIFSGILSGCGKHKRTLDYDHSRTRAYYYAKEMNAKKDGNIYKVEAV